MPVALLLLMILAPALVVLPLLFFHNVFPVFALYHIGLCLLLPAVVNRCWRRTGWTGHLTALGLVGAGTRRGLVVGAGLGVACAAAILGVFALWGERLLADSTIADTLKTWGVPPSHLPALTAFMVLVNGPAEELFWRGFVATELAPLRSRTTALLVPSLCYASYHAATVLMLVHQPAAAALMLAMVFGAGLGWAWLRERTHSVWPALLSHTAAVAAYMAIAWAVLRN